MGRQWDLAQTQASLQGNTRLLTLTGPVGVGKSRLAWSIAENLCDLGAFENAILCDLNGCDSSEACQDTLARAAGLSPLPRSVGNSLDSLGQTLLVLDGFDGPPTSLIGGWLEEAPSLSCLVTTRHLLGLAGELVHELGTLGLPVGGTLAGDAATFFLQCVAHSRPGYTPTSVEVPIVVELIRELDGLPLALQLAAPRLSVMGPAALLHRLRSSRSVLRAHSADPHAPKSFDAAMQSSWQALTQEGRDALTQLTVFSGSFSAEAAEQVVTTRETPVIDVLLDLRNRSMIVAQTEDDGTVRLRMLRGIHNFVLRHGDPKIRCDALERHAVYYAQQADDRIRHGRALSDVERRTWFSAERDNLLQVLRGVARTQAVTSRYAEPALRVALALDPVRRKIPSTQELSSLLETTLEASRDSGADPLLFGRALALRGSIRRINGHVASATRDLLQSLHVGRNLGCAPLQGRSLLELGKLLLQREQVDEAKSHFLQAMEAFRSAGAHEEEAATWLALAEVEEIHGRLEDAMVLMDRAVALFQRLGEVIAEASARCTLIRASIHAGDENRTLRQIEALRALNLPEDELVLLETDLLEAVHSHDTVGEPDSKPYGVAESAARHRGAASVEAETLAFQALARAQLGAFGDSHALLRAAFDACPTFPNAPLWSAIAAALDARVAPTVSTIPPTTTVQASEVLPQRTAIDSFHRLASAPSSWMDERSKLISLASRHVVIRLAVRAIDRTVSSSSRPVVPSDALAVGKRGRWFRMPSEPIVSLERRRPLALLLDRLAELRIQDTRAALPWDELQQTGWPGERIIAEAGAHRVRVAISTLRKLGLKDALETTPEGYKLSDALHVVRVEGECPG